MRRVSKHAAMSLAAILVPAEEVRAQESPPAEAAPAQAPATVLAPITVEGEKLERPRQETLTSVGVVTGQEVEDLGLRDVGDAFNLLGNVLFAPAQRGNNGFSIRGINSEGVAGPTNVIRPVASFIVDGATQSFEGTRRGQRGLFDVRQVEVLRGPQSTLQGRNALAGAVLVRTNDPSYDWEGALEGTVGTLETRGTAAMLSGPVVADQAAFRLVGELQQSAHDIDFEDDNLDDLDEDQYQHLRGKFLLEPDKIEGLSALFTVGFTSDQPGVQSVNGPDFFERKVTFPSSAFEIRESNVANYIADVGYEISPVLRLRSVSSYTTTDLAIGTPDGVDFARDESRDDDDYASDLRLEIGTPDSRLSGVAGLFAGRFKNRRDGRINAGPILVQDLVADTELHNQAAYTELRLEILDGLRLIGGMRYDRESYENRATVNFFGTTTRTDVDTDYDAWLPRFGIAYDLTANQTLALTATRGYRGGFVEVTTSGLANEVDPEYLWSYELAYRSLWLQDRLELNANLFRYDWDDQQVAIPDPTDPTGIGTITVNAGRSKVHGAEVEGRWEVDWGLSLVGSLGLLRTEFEDFDTAFGDFDGNEFPEAPQVTGSLGAFWHPSSGFMAAVNASYTGEYYSAGDIANTSSREAGSFWLIDASAGYETEHWSVRAYVRNLLDKNYLTSVDESGDEATVGDPLNVGLIFGLRF